MEIQFISPERIVTSTLSVTLGPALPGQTGRFGRQRRRARNRKPECGFTSQQHFARVFAANLASIRQNLARFNLVKCTRSLAELPPNPLFLPYPQHANTLAP